MKSIAIVAPSPTPFTVGGAEKLWWGMQEFINKHTSHQCELIKLPTPENSFWGLIESYQSFYELDLSHFDMVITGKYPAWMIRHPNHHIYMVHCLRGFYDCYHLMGLPKEIITDDPKIKNLVKKMSARGISIKDTFDYLSEIKNDKTISQNEFSFPSPLIKNIVRFFDSSAMKKVCRFSAISRTVANRTEYFPTNSEVDVIYPPSVLTELKNVSYDYFFTVSRLDTAKRIDILIKAYLKTDTTIPFKIAGTGPLTQELEVLIKDDPRIELLGFLNDKELVNYYSKAYAVLFIPYDEDYGLVTIEAMMCEKAVLTFTDSGGVTEFVLHRKTGLLCKPNADDLSKNIDYIANNPELCKEMGKAASRQVQGINWTNTVVPLLDY